MTILLFDMAPEIGGIAIFAAVAFFFIGAAIAFVAFKMLRKTFKFAVRVAIAAVIMAIAVAGTAAFYFMGSSNPPKRPRVVQPK